MNRKHSTPYELNESELLNRYRRGKRKESLMRELDTFLKEKNKKQAGKERRNRKRLSEFTVKEEIQELAACRNLYALSY